MVVWMSLWNIESIICVTGKTGKMQESQGLPLLLPCLQLFRPLNVLPLVKSCWPQKHLSSELTAHLGAVNVMCLHLQLNVYFQMLRGQFTASLVYRPSDFPLLQASGSRARAWNLEMLLELYHCAMPGLLLPAAREQCIRFCFVIFYLIPSTTQGCQRPASRGCFQFLFSLLHFRRSWIFPNHPYHFSTGT